MQKSFSIIAATVLIAQPVIAGSPPTKAERDRQIHEIVFQNYPPQSLAAGEEGPVFFTVRLDKDAHPVTCQVTHGSGFPRLDEATCDLIVQHAVFSAARDANGRVMTETAEGVVNWTLPGHPPAPINLSALATASKPEAQVCKKTLRTGTLSSYERTCMTPTQWAKQSDAMKQPYEDFQGRRGSTTEAGCNGGINCDDSTVGMFVNSHPKPQ